MKQTIFLLFVLVLITGCGGGSSGSPTPAVPDPAPTPQPPEPDPPPAEPTRTFKMGFTPWLYAATAEAQTTTYNRLNAHGDIIKHHFMGGVPWQEALDGTPYSNNLEGEINSRLAGTAANADVFLAIDSLNASRDSLSLYWGDNQNMPLPGVWASRSWSSPEVITAYINFASDLITRFNPTHFEYGTEISELIVNDPGEYPDFLLFAEAVYNALSMAFPEVKIMASVAMKSPGSNEMQAIQGSMVDIMPYLDVLGVSIYPYAFFSHADKGDPANLPANWLTQATLIANGKPLAISETGWVAEDLVIPAFSLSVSSDETKQAAYASLLLQSAQDMNMEFVIWWTVTDFDDLWMNVLAQDPIAQLWKDIGLYDENQQPRSALTIWDSWLSRPLL